MKHRPGRRRKGSYNSSISKRSRREKGNCGKKNWNKDEDRRLRGWTESVSAWSKKRNNEKYSVSKNDRRGRKEGNESTVNMKEGNRKKDVVVKTIGTKLILSFKLNYSSI